LADRHCEAAEVRSGGRLCLREAAHWVDRPCHRGEAARLPDGNHVLAVRPKVVRRCQDASRVHERADQQICAVWKDHLIGIPYAEADHPTGIHAGEAVVGHQSDIRAEEAVVVHPIGTPAVEAMADHLIGIRAAEAMADHPTGIRDEERTADHLIGIRALAAGHPICSPDVEAADRWDGIPV
jgi:hypothetical protein